MKEYHTIESYEDLIHTVKYTLQDGIFKGSFTQDIISQGRGAVLFETEILTTLDSDDLAKINKTSEDLKMRFAGDMLVVEFIGKSGEVEHEVYLDEYTSDNESIIVGIEVVACKPYDK